MSEKPPKERYPIDQILYDLLSHLFSTQVIATWALIMFSAPFLIEIAGYWLGMILSAGGSYILIQHCDRKIADHQERKSRDIGS